MSDTSQTAAPVSRTDNGVSPDMPARPVGNDSRHQSLPEKIARSVIRRLRRGRARLSAQLDRLLMHWASRSMFGSRLYYAFWNGAFGREQQAVLQGRTQYANDVRNPGETSALLRRNCHRLEKGLLMVPRRNVFATEYIGETVQSYCDMLDRQETGKTCLPPELQWAHDVLSKYFQVVTDTPPIAAARNQFEPVARQVRCSSGDRLPYRRDLPITPPVRLEDLARLSRQRRSVRWFLQEPVPRAMIDAAIDVAAQSPSACNRQPFEFRIFDDPDLAREVAALPMGTAGYDHNIPVMAVIIGQQRNYFDERDRHLIYIDSSLAAMGFVYALETQGLSSCCINWPDIESKEAALARVLGLSPDERAVMCLAIGYPDPEGLVAYSQKKPLDQLRRYNFE